MPLLVGIPELQEPFGATRAQSEGEDMGSVKSGAGRKGNPVLLVDSLSLSLSLAEQKAKGDVKKKGRLDPYAYIPLNRTKLNRRYSIVRGLAGAVGVGSSVLQRGEGVILSKLST